MNLHKNAPLIIRCDDTQMKISHREYVICQHQAGLGTAHLGFTALLYGKISMLVFASSGLSERSLAFEEINGSFRVFPNGRRDLACDISKWEIEAIVPVPMYSGKERMRSTSSPCCFILFVASLRSI